MDQTAGDKELKQLTEPVKVEKVAEEVGKARQAEDAGLLEIEAVLIQEGQAENKTAQAPAPKDDAKTAPDPK